MGAFELFYNWNKVDNVVNIAIKSFLQQQKSYLQCDSIRWPLIQGFNAQPTELTWHVSVRGALNWVLFMHHLSMTV